MVLLLLLLLARAHAVVPVKIGLRTQWGHTPLLLEGAEWLAAQGDAGLLFRFAEAAHAERVSPASTDEAQYNFTLRITQPWLSEQLRKVSALARGEVWGSSPCRPPFHARSPRKLLPIALAARAHSAAVHAHRTLALHHAPRAFDSTRVDAAFAVVGGAAFTDAESLAVRLADPAPFASADAAQGDHVYPGSGVAAGAPRVVVYANVGSDTWASFHRVLVAAQPRVCYVLRHRPPPSSRALRVPGYGVELHLKSTEYKVVDDVDAAPRAPRAADATDWELEPVPKAEVAGLGMRIAQAISSAPKPLELLQRLSQNFPSECHLYRNEKVTSAFRAAVETNQRRLQAGHTAVLVNGRHVNVENVNFFELLDIVTQEVRTVDALRSVPGLTPTAVRGLVVRNSQDPSRGAGGAPEQPHYDTRGAHVHYLNDVERDEHTRRWPPGLGNFLRQQWPGQPFLVRRNCFTVVVVADLTSLVTINGLAELWRILASTEHGTLGAVRVGVVLVGTSRTAVVLAKALHVLDSRAGLQLLGSVAQRGATGSALESLVDDALAPLRLTVGGLMESEESYPGTERGNAWRERFGLPQLDPDAAPRVFVNGKPAATPEGTPLLHVVAQAVSEAVRPLQVAVYHRQLADSETDIHAWWLAHHSAQPSFSRFGGPSTADTPFVALAGRPAVMQALGALRWLGASGDAVFSHVVVADVKSATGLRVVRSALRRLNSADLARDARVALVLRPVDAPEALELLALALEDSVAAALERVEALLQHRVHAPAAAPRRATAEAARAVLAAHDRFARESWGDRCGAAAVVVNGRLVPVAADAELRETDFAALERNERTSRLPLLTPHLAGSPDALLLASSVLGMDETAGIARHDLASLVSSVTRTVGANTSAALVIDALLDPLSHAGKKFSSLLLQLVASFDAEVNLVLNPVTELAELPLKQFYRYVAASAPRFDAQGTLDASHELTAVFERLPSKTLFSMSLDVPDAWLVEAVAAPYDLDNLRLADVADGVRTVGALYELTHLLVEGSCKDVTTSAPASEVRGMQLRLSDASASYETLVMEMGGYYQLKSTPGLWRMELQGRSAELFQVEGDSHVMVRDLSGVSHSLRVSRRADSVEPLLVPDAGADTKLAAYQVAREKVARAREDAAARAAPAAGSGGGILQGLWGGAAAAPGQLAVPVRSVTPANATINVFSVASGHLYERFLSIMMYTTRNATRAPIKFWFVRQFLSPQFKRALPHLAQHYGFSYELVTYNWPRWLRHQTVKQRQIWGMKILFLDVLFPLDVERVIFVDADQIVRDDLNKLHTLDLEGAVYAFTPFCSQPSNRRLETKGFRFWESGYWKETLGLLHYHISALFVGEKLGGGVGGGGLC